MWYFKYHWDWRSFRFGWSYWPGQWWYVYVGFITLNWEHD